MKKLFVLIIALALLTCTTALADVDVSVFEDAAGVTYTYDDMEDMADIISNTGLAELMWSDNSAMTINIRMFEDLYVLRLEVFATVVGGDKIGLDGVIIKTDNARYSFDLKAVDDYSNVGYGMESARCGLGETGLTMIADVLNSSEVKVRYCGSESDLDFVLTDAQKSDIQMFYDLYVAAGCGEQDLTIIEGLYPITVKD